MNPIFSGRSLNTPHEIPSALHGRTTFQKPTTALLGLQTDDIMQCRSENEPTILSQDDRSSVTIRYSVKTAKNIVQILSPVTTFKFSKKTEQTRSKIPTRANIG